MYIRSGGLRQFAPQTERARSLACVMLIAAICSGAVGRAAESGEFIGKVVVEWLDDPFVQKMRLAANFGFADPDGKTWLAREGQILDGRAFPPVAQLLVGPPLSGEFRKAFVVYENFTLAMSEPWQAVDRMLYSASRAEGMTEIDAKVVYMSAYAAGSRWAVKDGSNLCFSACHAAAPSLTWRAAVNERELRSWGEWVRANNPALDEIDVFLNAAIRRPGPHLFVQR